MSERIIFANPCHGNEPYILATLIASKLNEAGGTKHKIVMPWLYGERQLNILRELDVEAGTLYLDERLGDFYKKMLFKDGKFAAHIDAVLSNRDEAEKGLREYLKGGMKTLNVGSGETAELKGEIKYEISAGSKFTAGAPRKKTFYAFPAAHSELCKRTAEEGGLGFDTAALEEMGEMMAAVEKSYEKVFIPHYNTFSFDRKRAPFEREVATPPMKERFRPMLWAQDALPEKSVYIMASGTGSELKNVLKKVKEYKPKAIVPPWARELAPEADGFYSPIVIANKNVKKVVGRAGWGTIWLCQMAHKQFEHVPYTKGDDPEIYFNIKTLDSTDMLGQPVGNGIEFIAKKILECAK